MSQMVSKRTHWASLASLQLHKIRPSKVVGDLPVVIEVDSVKIDLIANLDFTKNRFHLGNKCAYFITLQNFVKHKHNQFKTIQTKKLSQSTRNLTSK